MITVRLLVMIEGTTTEVVHTAEKITIQHHRKTRNGGAYLRLYRGGRMVETHSYRRVERIAWHDDGEA